MLVSLVIPAFNEEFRLPVTLDKIITYLKKQEYGYEILVANDGSVDNTAKVVASYSQKEPRIKIVEISPNQGKGNAIKQGVLNATGDRIIFLDADGSTPIEEIEKLLSVIEDCDIAIGSRALKSEKTKVKTTILRKIPGRVFNFLVNTFLLPSYKDTQCGFKMFNQTAAKEIFSKTKIKGFSFDLEVLYLAKLLNFSVKEIPVNWTNVPGSKVSMLKDSIKMFIDIFKIRKLHKL